MSALEHIKEEEMRIAFDWVVFEIEGNRNLEGIQLLGEKFFTNEWSGSDWVGMLRVAGAPCGDGNAALGNAIEGKLRREFSRDWKKLWI